MIKSIIFDLDGTLIESLTSIVSSMNILLAREGFPTHIFDDFRMFVGDGVEKLVKRSFPDIGEDQIRKYTKDYLDIYIETWREKTLPFKKIPSMLSKFQENGIKMFILSNKMDNLTKIQTAEFFPDIYFNDVRGATTGIPKKPDPGVAIQMLETAGLLPGESIFIGDSGVDIQTGIKTGMITGGVLWGFRSRKELEDNEADHLFEKPEDIIETVFNNRS